MKQVKRLVAVAAATLVGLGGAVAATPATAAPSQEAAHKAIVEYWTPKRMAEAKALGVSVDPTTKKATKVVTPQGATTSVKEPSSTASVILGGHWRAGGRVQQNTGKVFFSMGGYNYVCSGAVVKDNVSTTSTISTAGHCVYDNEAGEFATNWMFVPNYDVRPRAIDDTRWGAWTAQAIHVPGAWARGQGLNQLSLAYDYAFVTVGNGGHYNRPLDAVITPMDIQFTTGTKGGQVYAFGYPASHTYSGRDLIYSRSTLGYDANFNNVTYQIDSYMNGGSSGGPWYQRFSNGHGTQFSVNSYVYMDRNTGENVGKTMHGPRFNATTGIIHNRSQNATGNHIVG